MRFSFLSLLLLWATTATVQIDARLLMAIQQNNPTSVQAALRAGASPNATDSLGATPLMWACYKADTTVVKLLVKAGAKTECRGVIRTDTSAYYGNLTGLAAGLNKLPLLRYLLETLKLPINEPEYNPETKKDDGWTPVEWAAFNGHLEVIKYLDGRGANLRVGNGNPIALASSNNQSAIMSFLLERELILPETHPNYARLRPAYYGQLSLIAQEFEKQRKFDPAILANEQLRSIYVDAVSTIDGPYATILYNLGYLYQSIGRYEQALPFFQQALSIYEQALGKTHPYYANSLKSLGDLYQAMGRYEQALPFYQQALSINEQALGKTHPNYASSLNSLGSFYLSVGRYEDALPFFQQALAIYEKALGKTHPYYASNLSSLGSLYQLMGRYEQALPFFQQALSIYEQAEQALGKTHPDYARSLYSLGSLYQSMGQYEQALPFYQQALSITEQALGKTHPNYASSLNSLGSFYLSVGRYEDALPFFQQALAIYEKALGKTHPYYASNLSSLGSLYQSMGRYEQALPFYQQALSITEQTLGKTHPDYASSLNSLGSLYQSMGRYEQALPFYQQALSTNEQALGKTHPYYASSLNNLGYLYQQLNRPQAITPLVSQAAAIYRHHVLDDIAVLDESTLRQYQQRFNNADFGYSMAHWIKDPQLALIAYNQTLLDKGAGLLAHQQLERLLQTSSDTLVQALATRRQALRQQLRQLYNTNAAPEKTAPLEQQVRDSQQALIQLLPQYRRAFESLRLEWKQVQGSLKADEAAIEFVSFQYFDKRWTDSTYYAALVVRPGWATPKLVWLTEEKELKRLLALVNNERAEAYVAQLYGEKGRGGVVEGNSTQTPVRSLYSQVWQPLDSLLAGVNQIYYAPSGLLHRINLGAISIGPRQRLSDKYRLTLLASTRQIALPPQAAPAYTNHALLMGNIPYDLDSVAYQAANRSFTDSRPKERMALVGIIKPVSSTGTRGGLRKLRPLENTGPEISAIADSLRKAGFQADTLLGWQNSEEAVYYYTGPNSPAMPRYQHFATHGYFTGDSTYSYTDKADASLRFKRTDNPLMQSGIVLAGGNHAYTGGKPLTGQEDGILTAYEISLLDWRKTELVVLSACETGLGDIRGSEGVYGLQRALKMAGVRNIVMTLWQVPDDAAPVMMEMFYGYLLRDKEHNIRQAFDRAIADMKKNTLNKPYLWAAFVLVE